MLGAASVLVVHARWWVLLVVGFFSHIRQLERGGTGGGRGGLATEQTDTDRSGVT